MNVGPPPLRHAKRGLNLMYFDPVLWSCKLQQKQKMKKFITQNCVRAESHLIGILSHFGHLQSAKEHHLSFKVKLLAKRRSAFAKRLLFQSIASPPAYAKCSLNTKMRHKFICEQSYKHSTIVNYGFYQR